jgi:4-hydroxybenzoyl-CoA reductase subunit beta
MLLLPDFQLHQPRTLAEAASLAAAHTGKIDFLAGGTDLLCNYKWMLNVQPHVISLRHIPEMNGIERRADGSWRLGGAVTLHQLERHPALMQAFPGLLDSLTHLATPLIRRTGTLAGNLLQDTRCHFFNQSSFWRESLGYCLKAEGNVCHVIPQKTTCYATYHGDVAPVLMTLDAAARLVSPGGERTIKLHEFFGGEGRVKHCKKPDEILAEVIIPAGAESLRTGYNKLRYRDAFDFPALGIAAALRLDGAKRIEALTIAVTAVLPHPYRADDLTAPFIGRPLTDSAIQQLCEQLRDTARPVKSLSTPPPDYRKKMVYVYTRRLLERLILL